jgi:FMN phosphatase YigB (HAD superfamily)
VSRFDAITFDFWDTLVRADTAATRVQRRLAIAEVLAAHGYPAEHDEINAAFDEAFNRFNDSWGRGEQFTGQHAAETVLDVLGHTDDEQVRIRVIDAYLSAPRTMQLDLTDNLVSTLQNLKDSGLRVGIVCDVGTISKITGSCRCSITGRSPMRSVSISRMLRFSNMHSPV